jgi:hypothetical protein
MRTDTQRSIQRRNVGGKYFGWHKDYFVIREQLTAVDNVENGCTDCAGLGVSEIDVLKSRNCTLLWFWVECRVGASNDIKTELGHNERNNLARNPETTKHDRSA